jgi:excinuclease ABC subunit A
VEGAAEDVRHAVLYGSGDDAISFTYHRSRRPHPAQAPFEGIIPNLERRYRTESPAVREELSKYISERPCPECHGARLNRPRATCSSPTGRCRSWWCCRSTRRCVLQRADAGRLARRDRGEDRQGNRERLGFLVDVGLDYLTLERKADTLSGGEAQRIRLASQIGAGLVGVMYVLDEPSIGLHQRDNERLLGTLRACATSATR